MNRVIGFGAIALLLATALAGCRLVRQAAAQGNPRPFRNESKVETVDLGGLQVSVWRPKGTGPSPLVVFSHGFHGSSTQSTFLMKALAEHGYLVLAPNHRDNGHGVTMRPPVGFAEPDKWTDATFKDRRDDIVLLLRTLKADKAWSSAIDWSKVALAGHSLGGYTVLGLAGGWASWKLPDVKAVLALSPYCTPFVNKKTLASIKVPVMYQTGTRDIGIAPFVGRNGGAYDISSSPAYYVEFEGAGHLAWTDLRQDYHDSVDYYCVAFLDKYLKGSSATDPGKKLTNVSDLRHK
jgi:predicted dienelactone hydrolase